MFINVGAVFSSGGRKCPDVVIIVLNNRINEKDFAIL
jgi:hypothetical protein